MKDENEHEKEKTIKKLIEANKHLRDDLKREAERYSIIEDKYKELLYKFNQLGKENAKNKKMVFQMTTGANIDSYNPFMENESDIPSGGREKKQYF
jgi:DNA repair exonuclease SbcCD ATPase subunit